MPRASLYSKEKSFNFRIDARLKAAFQAAAEAEDIPAAQVIRDFMRAYVEKKRQKGRVADARLQSAIIATAARDPGSDEAQVMKELESDLQYFLKEWK